MLFLIKITVTVGVVFGLSLVAERVSTRMAGVLSGFPLGTAIVLFFYGIEVGPAFAGASALYTLVGLIATQVFVFVYFLISARAGRFEIPLASIGGLAGFLAASWALQHLRLTVPIAVALPVASIFGFTFLFRHIPNAQIANPTRLTRRAIVVRAALAAGIVILITAVGKLAGAEWAGLLSAFPTTLFPLMLIVHITYDRRYVHTIIKNFPIGLGALIAYSLCVSQVYPAVGIFAGTLVAFAAAIAYLLAYQAFRRRFDPRQ